MGPLNLKTLVGSQSTGAVLQMKLIHFLLFHAFEDLVVLPPLPVLESLKDLSLAAGGNDEISLFGGLRLKLDCLGTQLPNLFAKV